MLVTVYYDPEYARKMNITKPTCGVDYKFDDPIPGLFHLYHDKDGTMQTFIPISNIAEVMIDLHGGV